MIARESIPIITIDLDWAPDFAIDLAANRLVESQVRATWFVTHSSPAVDRLKAHPDLFELGIHPNFLPGSSHGANQVEVLRHCLELVPSARCVRTHSLVQSSRLLAEFTRYPSIAIDASAYLPHANPAPETEFWWEGRCIRRIPHVWEDDLEAMRPTPVWRLAPIASGREAPYVLAFHPLYLFVNDATPQTYACIKKQFSKISEANESELAPFVSPLHGPRTVFEEAIGVLSRHSGGVTLSGLTDSISESLRIGRNGA